MTKKRIQKIALAVVCLLAFSCTAVGASTVAKNITVYYRNIQIVVDGIKENPDAEPFIYNGTTYLPVRAVSEALGERVEWDGTNNTVYIGEQPGEKQYLIDVCPPYEAYSALVKDGEEGQYISMAGDKYTNGIHMFPSSFAYFNLHGQYEELELTIGHPDDGGVLYSGTVVFIVDGQEVARYDGINVDTMPYKITVPLNHGTQLLIQNDTFAQVGLMDITVR